jgi:hypothetical protein
VHSLAQQSNATSSSQDALTLPYWFRAITLIIWLAACVVPFLPFAQSTSPLDAVLLHVPGDQGNWWHFLAGLPFFLAFPLLWLTVQSVGNSKEAPAGLRLFAGIAALSGIGTILVEVPFLLHLAGTSAWQSFSVLSLGLGILLVSAVILILRRRFIQALDLCVASLIAAFLANASLCLVVYASEPGAASTRSGWFITLALAGPMALELMWILVRKPQSRP